MKKIAKSIIIFYQKYISKNTMPHCRYIPTCSNYALEAYEKYSFLKASYLTIKRIIRCNPFSKGGYDPVP